LLAVFGSASSRPDLLIAGAGLAGLYGALQAADRGAAVTLVTKGSLRASNSFMAQGGVAAAIGPGDDPGQHLADTITAGRGLCDAEAVRVLVTEGIDRITDLARMGVEFDREPDGTYSLGREGGHGRRRILHAGGATTGAVIAETLISRVAGHPRIEVLEHTAVVELISDGTVCSGAWLLGHDELRPLQARMTLIATGGAGAVFARTTNPPGTLGDGIAIAYRAGAGLRDMEFVQFHPTALAVGARAFLISEAVRGEGAYLVDEDGRRFMPDVHPDAELAPRDIVARTIDERRSAGRPVFLSLAHLDAARIRTRFANLAEGVATEGLDLTSDPIPVAPAAHYLMGGIETDLTGATTLAGLYASGECAATGVHGANRLASNSLLECFVFSHRAVSAGMEAGDLGWIDTPPPDRPRIRAPLPELKQAMWTGAGPARTADGLTGLVHWLDEQQPSNPVLTSRVIAAAALRRCESRGAHTRLDYPTESPTLAHSLRCPPLHLTV
jgi:L-aspartate oxidase